MLPPSLGPGTCKPGSRPEQREFNAATVATEHGPQHCASTV